MLFPEPMMPSGNGGCGGIGDACPMKETANQPKFVTYISSLPGLYAISLGATLYYVTKIGNRYRCFMKSFFDTPAWSNIDLSVVL